MKVSLEGLDLGPQAGPCGSIGGDGPVQNWALAMAVNLVALEEFFSGFGESRFLGGLRKQARAAEAIGLTVAPGRVAMAIGLGRAAGECAQDMDLPVEGVALWWAEAARASFALSALGGGLGDPDAQEGVKAIHKACRAALRLLYRDAVADQILTRATGDDAGDFLLALADDVVSGGFTV